MQHIVDTCPEKGGWKLLDASFFIIFLIGIHSMQGWTATARHGVTRKRSTKRSKHIGNLFRKCLQLMGVCLLFRHPFNIHDRKTMQPIRITRALSRERHLNQCSQFRWTFRWLYSKGSREVAIEGLTAVDICFCSLSNNSN